MQLLFFAFLMGVCADRFSQCLAFIIKSILEGPNMKSWMINFLRILIVMKHMSWLNLVLQSVVNEISQGLPNSSIDRCEKESPSFAEVYVRDGRNVDGLFHLRSNCNIVSLGFYTKFFPPCALCGGVLCDRSARLIYKTSFGQKCHSCDSCHGLVNAKHQFCL